MQNVCYPFHFRLSLKIQSKPSKYRIGNKGMRIKELGRRKKEVLPAIAARPAWSKTERAGGKQCRAESSD
jgi:hypothetical protein